jgi:hypothetical protein
MSKITIQKVAFLNEEKNTPFTNDLELEVYFNCAEYFPDDIEFKLIYVSDLSKEMVLESIFVGEIEKGINQINIQVSF